MHQPCPWNSAQLSCSGQGTEWNKCGNKPVWSLIWITSKTKIWMKYIKCHKLSKKSKRNFPLNKNENRSLWNATKIVVRSTLTALKAFIWKEEKSQINNLSFFLKKIEKESKASEKEIIKSRNKRNWKQKKEKSVKLKAYIENSKESTKWTPRSKNWP